MKKKFFSKNIEEWIERNNETSEVPIITNEELLRSLLKIDFNKKKPMSTSSSQASIKKIFTFNENNITFIYHKCSHIRIIEHDYKLSFLLNTNFKENSDSDNFCIVPLSISKYHIITANNKILKFWNLSEIDNYKSIELENEISYIYYIKETQILLICSLNGQISNLNIDTLQIKNLFKFTKTYITCVQKYNIDKLILADTTGIIHFYDIFKNYNIDHMKVDLYNRGIIKQILYISDNYCKCLMDDENNFSRLFSFKHSVVHDNIEFDRIITSICNVNNFILACTEKKLLILDADGTYNHMIYYLENSIESIEYLKIRSELVFYYTNDHIVYFYSLIT